MNLMCRGEWVRSNSSVLASRAWRGVEENYYSMLGEESIKSVCYQSTNEGKIHVNCSGWVKHIRQEYINLGQRKGYLGHLEDVTALHNTKV